MLNTTNPVRTVTPAVRRGWFGDAVALGLTLASLAALITWRGC